MKRLLIVAAAVVIAAAPVSGYSERSVPTVTVRHGDTLSEIAASSPYPWTRWAWVNRHTLPDPNVLAVGDVLVAPQVDGKRLVPPRPVVGVSRSTVRDAGAQGGSSNAYVDPSCEASHSQQWSASGRYWGKYQFDAQTWAAHGGDPAEYGSASEAEQDRVAARVTYDAWPNC